MVALGSWERAGRESSGVPVMVAGEMNEQFTSRAAKIHSDDHRHSDVNSRIKMCDPVANREKKDRKNDFTELESRGTST
jgi:hypothetical protein